MRAVRTAAGLTEKRFLQQVYDLARLVGWRAYHTWWSRHSAPGFPDLVLLRGSRGIAAELKVRGRVTPEQQAWLDAFRAAGFEAYVWRPEDWPELEEALR